MNFIAQALNLSKSAASRLDERNILRKAFVKHPFFADIEEAFRFEKKFGQFEEGTVVVKAKDSLKVFRGFPKIKRTLLLNPTIKKHFGSRDIVLEEKMNGYNVRIVKIGENLYAITRRGLICPYTTEKARILIDDEFFRDYPDYMLCCEAVGKASPYVPTEVYGIENLDFFLFDIREGRTNRPLTVDEKIEIAKIYGLKLAEILATVSSEDTEKMREIIEKLDRNRREGVVFKDREMKLNPLKYTTSYANQSDLRYAFRFFGEYGRDFMLSRVVREAFQSFEFEDEEKFNERCLQLGRAILEPMIESIRACKRGEMIYEESELVFENQEVIELFKMHMRLLGVEFRVEVLDEGRIRLKRVMRGTSDKIKGILQGSYWK
uniref:RNA ligase n=1 Tax=Archaeoglobus fulgidus TaxID=2234 RepID=A0A7C2SNN2_ARCFL